MAQYLRNAAEMKAEFAKLCPEPWFATITDQVVAKFAGKHIPDGNGSVGGMIVVWICREAAKAGQKDHPLMKDQGIIVKMIQVLTTNTWLQTDIATFLAGVIEGAGTIA